MRKIFFLTALLMMILTATAFAAEEPAQIEKTGEPYLYTSEDFKYSISCPIKPVAVVQNPWEETDRRGEMLVFVNEGFEVLYGYIIQVNAFKDNEVPDFNRGTMAAIGDYLTQLKENNGFGSADLVNITKKNKGVFAVTAEKIEVLNKETGEVEGEFVADKQYMYTFFRTPEGRCISIQLITADNSKSFIDTYRYGVASFKDLSKGGNAGDKKSKDKKSKDKKDKNDKKDKSKDKKDKK